MNLRHFKIFKVLCENKNMTKTAQLLHMTQPAVSQVVRELESYYNVVLFERLNKRLYLTIEGEKLQSHVNGLLCLYDQLDEEMLNHMHPKVRIGATVTIGTYGIGVWLKPFKRKYPNVELEIHMMNTKELRNALLKSELDIGLSEGIMGHHDLIVQPFYKDELVVIAPIKDPISNVGKQSELMDKNFFLREEGSGSRKLALKAFEEKGIPIKVIGSFTNNEAIINAVESELGFGIVSQLALKQHHVKRIACDFLNLERDFNLVYHKDKKMTEHLMNLIEIIKMIEKA
ncbi:MAG: LysR family transcriptional regulator [Clostridia bacterium]|nr:LysR family transcriptional regulator [Clostridia bacterium]